MFGCQVEVGDVPHHWVCQLDRWVSLDVLETLVSVTMTNLCPSILSSHFINAPGWLVSSVHEYDNSAVQS